MISFIKKLTAQINYIQKMGKHNLAIKEITSVIVIKTMKNYQWM
jgi:hypothetical protein